MAALSRKKDASPAIICGIVICIVLLVFTCIAILVTHFYPVRYVEYINKYSDMFGLDPAFVCAVINAESRFNAEAKSGAGAGGLMQIMEDTADWIAPAAGLPDFSYSQIFEPDVNIRLGCYYLSMYKERFGSLDIALCAYNAGGGRVEGWLSEPRYSSDGVSLDVIPYEETRLYVQRVNSNMRVYEILLRFVD